jgi:hypothetical protein
LQLGAFADRAYVYHHAVRILQHHGAHAARQSNSGFGSRICSRELSHVGQVVDIAGGVCFGDTEIDERQTVDGKCVIFPLEPEFSISPGDTDAPAMDLLSIEIVPEGFALSPGIALVASAVIASVSESKLKDNVCFTVNIEASSSLLLYGLKFLGSPRNASALCRCAMNRLNTILTVPSFN